MRRLVTPARLAVLGLVALAVAAILYVTPSDDYLFLPDRAQPLAPKVVVEGERASDSAGGIYYVAVDVRRATILESYFPSVYEGSTLVPEDVVLPPGVDENARREVELKAMRRSQQVAAAVALRAAGYDVRVNPTGVLVTTVFTATPAAGKLRPSDVVVSVNGRRVLDPAALGREVRRRPPGSTVRLRVRRDGQLRTVTLKTARSPDDPRRPIVGIGIEPAASIRLPLKVKIDLGGVGGPSAGLAFALDILEELGRNVDRGRKVAATGELALDGSVGRVGGLKQKTIGARRAGVDVFVVPAGENEVEALRYADGLHVVPVRTFRQALRALATLPNVR